MSANAKGGGYFRQSLGNDDGSISFGTIVSGIVMETIFRPIRKSDNDIWTSASSAASDLFSVV
jgi:hypothetical protein